MRKPDLVYIDWKYVSYLSLLVNILILNLNLGKFKTRHRCFVCSNPSYDFLSGHMWSKAPIHYHPLLCANVSLFLFFSSSVMHQSCILVESQAMDIKCVFLSCHNTFQKDFTHCNGVNFKKL